MDNNFHNLPDNEASSNSSEPPSSGINQSQRVDQTNHTNNLNANSQTPNANNDEGSINLNNQGDRFMGFGGDMGLREGESGNLTISIEASEIIPGNTNTNNTDNNNNSNANNMFNAPRFRFNGGNANAVRNSTPFVEELLNAVFGSMQQKHKKANKSQLVKLLNPVKLADLPEDQKNCSICLDDFEEFIKGKDYSKKDESKLDEKSHKDEKHLPDSFHGYHLDDPPISFPHDETAVHETHFLLATDIPALQNSENQAITGSTNNKLNAESDDQAHYAVKLPQCNHIFGRSCIMEWLSTNISCPLCRRDLQPELTENPVTRVTYSVALTEVFIPVNWMTRVVDKDPNDSRIDDPDVNFPVEGDGFSMGYRRGPDPSIPRHPNYNVPLHSTGSSTGNTLSPIPSSIDTEPTAIPAPSQQQQAWSSSHTSSGTGGPTRSSNRVSARIHPYSRPASSTSDFNNSSSIESNDDDIRIPDHADLD